MELQRFAQQALKVGDNQNQAIADLFIGLSLEAYLGEQGIDPFGMNPNSKKGDGK